MRIIKGKKVSIISDSKYQFGKTQKEIKEAFKSLGAEIVSDYDKSDFVILGKKNLSLHFLNKKNNIIVETELIDKKVNHFNYFEGIEQKVFDMLRGLISMDNITVDMFEVGSGVTEKEFEAIEKRLKKTIPASIKEFYSVFGYIKMLWHFDKPPETYRKIYHNSLYLHSGQHNGCINILPITKFLFEDWKNPELYLSLPKDKDVRLFDLYSDSHIFGCELSNDEDPKIYLGSDHGASFDLLENLKFSDYIKTEIGIYGYLNRLTNTNSWLLDSSGYIFDQPHIEDIKDVKNIQKSNNGFVLLDTSNAKEIENYKTQSWEKIRHLMSQNEYKKAFEKARAFSSIDINAYSVMLDVWVIEENKEMFFKGIKIFSERGFSLNEYEIESEQRKYIDTSEYQEFKKTLSNTM